METIRKHIARVEDLMLELAKELESLDPGYIGGEDWDPDEGYRFTADSISPLREGHSSPVQQSSGPSASPRRQKDLSECINASRIRHQTEWVLKKKMPARDSHVLMCISFCDGAIPEPPNPYYDTSSAHPGKKSINLP